MGDSWRKGFTGLAVLLVSACGGGGGGGSQHSSGERPAAPTALASNAGDSAVSLAWTPPATGTGPFSYAITLSPSAPAATTTISGNAAVVRNLSNGTAYTFTLKASNSSGDSPTTTVTATPAAVGARNTFSVLSVLGDAGAVSGIYDPALLRQSSSDVWMAYSSVRYALSGATLIQDVSTSLARSSDGGATFNFVRTLGAAGPATVTDPARSACGAITCSGRWVYETPWLIDDSTDTNSARRFKLFAHKYFLLPGRAQGATLYHLGAIAMWTAPALNGVWSPETSVIGWNLTPAELLPVHSNINALSGVSDCLLVGEGSAAVTSAGIDLVFNCPFSSGSAIPQKIVLLRSTDHAQSFQFVSTLLQPSDASGFGGAQYFSAPSIIPAGGNAQALMVTPVIRRSLNGGTPGDYYSGCAVIPFADVSAGTLVRDGSNAPIAIATLPAPLTPVLANHLYGACAWDRGVTTTGILMNDVSVPAQPDQVQFTVLATHKSM